MESEERDQLEKEKYIGAEKQVVFTAHVEPFLNTKRKQLFDAFCDTKAQDTEQLQVIRMQVSALDAIEADFCSYITTGKMASITLNEKGK